MDKKEKNALASELNALFDSAAATEESITYRSLPRYEAFTSVHEHFAYPTAPQMPEYEVDMRGISDYFERDSRRYDGGEELWS